MKKHIFQIVISLSLIVLAPLLSLPLAYGAPGDFLYKWGSQDPYSRPSGVAVDASGNVYSADSDGDRVLKFDSLGNLTKTWGGRGTGNGLLTGPWDVAVSANGNVYVADTNNNRIQVFDSAGNFVRKFGSYGTGNGQFAYPQGVAVSAGGTIYVADTSNNRIQVFDSAGTFVRKFGGSGTGNGQFANPKGVAVDAGSNVYVADTSNNRIQVFDSTGNFLRKFGSAGSGNGQFSNPRGVAVDASNYLYVADIWNHRIQVFSSTGNFVRKFGSYGTSNGQFVNPWGVTVDVSGNIYVADYNNHRMQVFNTAGTFLRVVGSTTPTNGLLNYPYTAAVDAGGNVYVADKYDCRLEAFDGNGNFLRTEGSFGSGNGQLLFPRGIAVDGNGTTYAVDTDNNRIEVFDSTGNFLRKWGSYGTGNGQFNAPLGVAVNGNGTVYVSDSSNNRIQVFDNSGTFLKVIGRLGSGNGYFNWPHGITVGASGNLYVADAWNNRVQVFDSAGNFLRAFGSAGTGNGQFAHPRGVAVDGSGNIYVADSENDRVQVFTNTGGFLGKWGSHGSGNGQFNFPTGMAVDGGARVYVVDYYNSRIQAFVGYGSTTQTFTISGTVTSGGSPLANVVMSGLPGSPLTNASGVYTGTVSSGWSGTVTPTLAGYAFTPASKTYSNVTSTQTQNYTVTSVQTFTISGPVTFNGSPLANVVMNGLPGNPATNTNGVYTGTVSYGWSGTVTPTLTWYTFTPPSSIYNNITANQAQNYTATSSQTFTISGTVTSNGSPLANVVMNGLPGNPATNTNGVYTGTVSSGWSGTVTPTLAGYTFTPASKTYSSVTSNQTQNFTAITVLSSGWTAYNDCVYDPAAFHSATDPNGQLVTYKAANVTTFGIGTDYSGPTSGMLLDQATGSPTGVTVTLTQNGGVVWMSDVSSDWYGGYDTALGTDARTTFGGICDMTGTIHYGASGWWVDLTFTGLNPAKTYTFATSASRANSSYPSRNTLYTLSGVDAATNASTTGVNVIDNYSVWFNTGDNHSTGYVARWTGIQPGADGSFTVRAQAYGSEYRAYAFDVFMLREEGDQTFTLNFVPGANGTITGTSSQTVNYGGSSTAVTAVPNSGYVFVNWTGTNGFVTTTANPLAVNNVTTSQTITANFANTVTYISDTFQGTGTSTTLQNHTGDTGATWTLLYGVYLAYIDGPNSAVYSSSDANYYNTYNLPVNDYSIIATVHMNIPASGTNCLISGRTNPDTRARYVAGHTSGLGWGIYYMDGLGHETLLAPHYGQTSLSANTTYNVELRIVGTNITIYVNNVLAASVTDSALPTGNHAGLETCGTGPGSNGSYEVYDWKVTSPSIR